ncbi:hypothetical protein ACIO13_25770 [Streptomyces sp. NPDC087425]
MLDNSAESWLDRPVCQLRASGVIQRTFFVSWALGVRSPVTVAR